MGLIQITYSSAARQKFDEIELELLLDRSRYKNELNGVTGMMLYHKRSFLQVLEGEEEQVCATFDRITRDTRHEEVLLLLRAPVRERSFREWSMGFVHTKKAGNRLEGFDDMVAPDESLADVSNSPGKVGRILASFQKGHWRQAVAV